MFKKSFLVTLVLGLMTSSAFANQADIDTIVNLATQIRIAAKNTTASDSDLKTIIQDLKSSLNILNTSDAGTGGGVYDSECFKFAYAKYYIQSSAVDATNLAMAACKKVEDFSITQYFYGKFYIQSSAADAMTMAADRSGKAVKGKLDMIEFAYAKYYVQLSAVDASIKAYNKISLVKRGNLGCLQQLYPKYYVSMSAADAMDAASSACQ